MRFLKQKQNFEASSDTDDHNRAKVHPPSQKPIRPIVNGSNSPPIPPRVRLAFEASQSFSPIRPDGARMPLRWPRPPPACFVPLIDHSAFAADSFFNIQHPIAAVGASAP
jgi:hypothetical protein